MPRTGFWFQMARGRAIVRKNAMREARRIKAAFARQDRPLTDTDRRIRDAEIGFEVARARRANRDWRQYRALHQAHEL